MLKSVSTQNRRSEPLESRFADLRDRVGGACAIALASPADDRAKPAPAADGGGRRGTRGQRIAAPTTTLERIRSTGKIVLGYRPDAAPMSYRDASGQPGRYSVTLCNKVADAMKSELSLSSLAWSGSRSARAYADVEQHASISSAPVTRSRWRTAQKRRSRFRSSRAASRRSSAPMRQSICRRTLEERPPP